MDLEPLLGPDTPVRSASRVASFGCRSDHLLSARVSSTLDRSVGKRHLLDGNPESCWSSQQVVCARFSPSTARPDVSSARCCPQGLAAARPARLSITNYPQKCEDHISGRLRGHTLQYPIHRALGGRRRIHKAEMALFGAHIPTRYQRSPVLRPRRDPRDVGDGHYKSQAVVRGVLGLLWEDNYL
jgi:hypothetical protein